MSYQGKPQPTRRLYWEDDHCFEAEATVVAVRDTAVAFNQTCFYPGGGGQPPDRGCVILPDGATLDITTVFADTDAVIWHVAETPAPPDLVGQSVRLCLDQDRRLALMRYHTVLHVLNTIALRDYGGWITGVQIGADYSRIDFKIEGFSPALCAELEAKVNAVLADDHSLRAYSISEAEFRQRDDLRRTLEAEPPVYDGRVRVVTIEGFDAQACGGTHMHRTSEVGRFSIFRTENKGRINKRLYVRLD
ncbi:MAG: alanyl-tRNA editing protein [Anaerolineae bacterium]